MKILFVEAQRNIDDIDINRINFDILPSKIFLVYSIQYKKIAKKIEEKLKERVVGMQQVLGCTQLKTKEPILLIGSGKFHALSLSLQNNTIYILEENKIKKIDEKEVEKLKNRRKTAMLKFLSADSVGILVSCKPGQENLSKALKLKENLEKKDKSCFIFVADNINISELENFNLECFVNTACPALVFDAFDYPILNISDIEM